MSNVFGANGLKIIAIIIAISAFGCANGMILTGSRIYYKMAKDRLFFRRLAYIERKTRVPKNSPKIGPGVNMIINLPPVKNFFAE